MDLLSYSSRLPFAHKHLLDLVDYSQEDILQMLSFGLKLKTQNAVGMPHHILRDKTLAMIFSKSSTRTRVSFEVGMYQLGGIALYLNTNDIQLGRGETISDTAKTLSRMVNGIMIRTYAHEDVVNMSKHSDVPVINGLTDLHHPSQALADMLTIYEHKQKLSGLKLAYIGDGNNVVNSLLIICAKLGLDISVASPKGYEPLQEIVDIAKKEAEHSGSKIIITNDAKEAVSGADVVYTDVWASMGQEKEFLEKSKHFLPYQVNADLVKYANPEYIFLHCLPAHRGEEVTTDIIDGAHSVVFDEAENRLHMHKSIMATLMYSGE